MSASRNADASSNQPGQIGSHIARDEPLTTHGHKPGVKVGNDAAPEFSAKTLPPGTAPKESTYQPNPIGETPGQADNASVLRSHGKESTETTASSTLFGASSGDVHKGYGHPGQGQTSSELRDNSKSAGGLSGVGASGAPSGNMGVDERVQEGQRALGSDFTGSKGVRAGDDVKGAAAEERPNEGL